jgi:hypothetical protein
MNDSNEIKSQIKIIFVIAYDKNELPGLITITIN